jgi:uncharacterized protein
MMSERGLFMQATPYPNRLFVLARQGVRLPHLLVTAVMSVVFLLAGGVLGTLPALLILRVVLPGGRGSLVDAPILSAASSALLLAAGFGGAIVCLAAWIRWVERRPFASLGFERESALFRYVRGFAWGVGMFSMNIAISAALGYLARTPQSLGPAIIAGALLALLGWLVQGAAEEILFRGWVLPVIGARYRPWVGVLVSSILFAVLHLANPGIGPVAVLNLFLFGVFAALYALHEQSLWGIIGWHAAWNWVQGNVFGMEVSGTNGTAPSLLALSETGPDLLTGGAFGPEGGLIETGLLICSIIWLGWRYTIRTQQSSTVESLS